jgi:protein required for attachment to host cells
MQKEKRQWILVADGANARIFEKDSPSSSMYQVMDLTCDHELTHEHGRDAPGSSFGTATAMQHMYEKKTDWHDHQKEIFSKKLAELFIRQHTEKNFSKIYLVCPPVIMGYIRKDLEDYLGKLPNGSISEIKEINKDLIHHPLHEIEKLIAD